MASRKGIGVTIAILVGVVAASFLVYLIPEDTTMKITVSDFGEHLDICLLYTSPSPRDS